MNYTEEENKILPDQWSVNSKQTEKEAKRTESKNPKEISPPSLVTLCNILIKSSKYIWDSVRDAVEAKAAQKDN